MLHYSGAAARAGSSYLGALLCSADGLWPAGATSGAEYARITAALAHCGLEPWELYGHGPPTLAGDGALSAGGPSYMWPADHAAWASANPPPLDRIGDVTVSVWRKQERAKAAAAERI